MKYTFYRFICKIYNNKRAIIIIIIISFINDIHIIVTIF